MSTDNLNLAISEDLVGEWAANNESEETVEQIITPEPAAAPVNPDWTISLRDVNVGLKVTEFGQIYQFIRVLDPNKNKTDKFLVFCQDPNILGVNEETGENIWAPMNGLLSHRYVVASLEKFVNALQNQIEITGEPTITRGLFKVFWNAKTNNPIDVVGDDASRMMFSLASGIDIDTVDSITSNLNIGVYNSYNGTKSLRIDYIIETNINSNNGEEENVIINDYFTLGKFSTVVAHLGNLTQIGADLTNIQQNLQGTIDTLTQYNDGLDNIVESFSAILKKTNKNKLHNLYENLGGEFKNLYNVLLIMSTILSQDYSFEEHDKAHSIVQKLFNRIF